MKNLLTGDSTRPPRKAPGNDERKYYVVYKCTNCLKIEEMSFKCGTPVPTEPLKCSNCECKTLVRKIS